MNVQSVLLAIGVAAGMISGACTSSAGNSSGTGGSHGSGTGGSSSGGAQGGSCANVTACGGNLVGTWNVTSSCLQVTGDLDLTLVGAGCPSAPVSGSLQVTGAWTANPDGTYTDATTTTGTEQLTLAPACLVISSTPVTCSGAASIIQSLGYATLTCTAAAGGGCTCSGTVQQMGVLGLVSVAPTPTGNYTTSGNLVTVTGDVGDTAYSYCVSGNTLTMTPQSSTPTMTGTIVLQKSGSSGTGGTTGAAGGGGTNGSAGTTGAAGAGAAGRGGTTGTAGATGVAGRGGTTG